MTKHKWHKEIKAWADGAEIEVRIPLNNGWSAWVLVENKSPQWFNENQYRIKPQPKEPQYLYVYMADEGYHFTRLAPQESKYMEREQVVCIGKIKLEEVE